jgi:hypothetical protein
VTSKSIADAETLLSLVAQEFQVKVQQEGVGGYFAQRLLALRQQLLELDAAVRAAKQKAKIGKGWWDAEITVGENPTPNS